MKKTIFTGILFSMLCITHAQETLQSVTNNGNITVKNYENSIIVQEGTSGNNIKLYQQAGTSYLIASSINSPPTQRLAFYTGDSEKLSILANGNLGVGTGSPIVKLDVNGSINMPDGHNLTWGGYYGPGIPTIAASAGAGINFYPAGSTLNSTMAIAPNGNVLIGKTSQSNTAYKLDVAGKARVNEIVVNTTGADFVFEKNYKLRSLTEVETFIKQNKHLPEMSNAKAMQADGIGVSEMQTKLLQKVEELTLYLIGQNKRIAAHQEIQEKQQKEIAQLKALLNKKR